MTTFVLVHGAWRGGWCWREVVSSLRALGHEVHAPSLAGLADRRHLASPSTNLETHILDIVHLLQWEDLSDVVLCGHSYAGMVITGVADRIPDRVRALVYLDAFAPEHGQSMLDVTLPERRAAHQSRIDHETGGWMVKPPPVAFSAAAAKDADRVSRPCTAHPLACFEQKLELVREADPSLPKIFVEATRFVPSPFEGVANRLRSDPTWRVLTVDTGHDVMIEDPQACTAILVEAAAATADPRRPS